jgi:hypothetical protein
MKMGARNIVFGGAQPVSSHSRVAGRVIPLMFTVLCLAMTPRPALAQPVDPETTAVMPGASAAFGSGSPSLVPRLSVSPERLQVSGQSPKRVVSRDSIRNGAIIGAMIGAVVAGAFAAAVCHVYQEEGGASCVPDTLRFAAIGGAIGIGAGLAIDAARSRNSGAAVRLAITF